MNGFASAPGIGEEQLDAAFGCPECSVRLWIYVPMSTMTMPGVLPRSRTARSSMSATRVPVSELSASKRNALPRAVVFQIGRPKRAAGAQDILRKVQRPSLVAFGQPRNIPATLVEWPLFSNLSPLREVDGEDTSQIVNPHPPGWAEGRPISRDSTLLASSWRTFVRLSRR